MANDNIFSFQKGHNSKTFESDKYQIKLVLVVDGNKFASFTTICPGKLKLHKTYYGMYRQTYKH